MKARKHNAKALLDSALSECLTDANAQDTLRAESLLETITARMSADQFEALESLLDLVSTHLKAPPAPVVPPAQERNPEGEVLRTHRVTYYGVGTTGRLYSARVREEYPGAWSALLTCTHLDSYGRATVSMGGSPTVACRTMGTFASKARATKKALEALNLHTADMRYTVEEPEDSAIVRPISE